MDIEPGKPELEKAYNLVKSYVHRTPILTSKSINKISDSSLFFKCENLQKVGAFKFRGACNAIFSMEPSALANGVATHSSGNHAQALALAAASRLLRLLLKRMLLGDMVPKSLNAIPHLRLGRKQ